MIGLSLSFCIQDVIEGRVREEDLDRIISGTRAETPAQWGRLLVMYRDAYWRTDPDWACAIANRLMSEGRIDQPRTRGEEPPKIILGHWITEGGEFVCSQ